MHRNLTAMLRDTFAEANNLIGGTTPVPEALLTLLGVADELTPRLSSTDESELKSACDELQHAVARYIDAHAVLHHIVGKALHRRVRPPIADVVTEAVNLAVHAMVSALDGQDGIDASRIEVKSEEWARQYEHENGQLTGKVTGSKKPDVSVWYDGKLCFVIEVKTNLGWLRPTKDDPAGWRGYFEDLQHWYAGAYFSERRRGRLARRIGAQHHGGPWPGRWCDAAQGSVARHRDARRLARRCVGRADARPRADGPHSWNAQLERSFTFLSEPAVEGVRLVQNSLRCFQKPDPFALRRSLPRNRLFSVRLEDSIHRRLVGLD